MYFISFFNYFSFKHSKNILRHPEARHFLSSPSLNEWGQKTIFCKDFTINSYQIMKHIDNSRRTIQKFRSDWQMAHYQQSLQSHCVCFVRLNRIQDHQVHDADHSDENDSCTPQHFFLLGLLLLHYFCFHQFLLYFLLLLFFLSQSFLLFQQSGFFFFLFFFSHNFFFSPLVLVYLFQFSFFLPIFGNCLTGFALLVLDAEIYAISLAFLLQNTGNCLKVLQISDVDGRISFAVLGVDEKLFFHFRHFIFLELQKDGHDDVCFVHFDCQNQASVIIIIHRSHVDVLFSQEADEVISLI